LTLVIAGKCGQFAGNVVFGYLKAVSYFAALIALATMVVGCAAMTALPLSSMLGSPNSSALNVYHTTEIRLEQRNFVVVKTNVVGQTSGFSLLGVITIVPAKFTKALSRLYANADMRPGQSQTIVNMNINQDSTYLILFSIPRTYVSGDVVEFISTNAAEKEARPPSQAAKPPSAL
jgi:hypothetical protein